MQQFRNNDGYRERSNHSDIGTCNQSNERTSRKNRQRDKKNWYRHDAENRLHRISEAGKKRNEDAKQFYESSQHYDNLKRAFYHVTDAAYIEGDISQKGKKDLKLLFQQVIGIIGVIIILEKTEYLSKIHKNDRKSLEELLEIKRKGCKRSNNAK